MNAKPLVYLSLVVLILFALTVPAFAQGPDQPGTPTGKAQPPAPLAPPEPPAASLAAPAASGGPDDFGYTWSDTAYNWIDATAGVRTGITGDDQYGRVDLPFPFKFYGQTWTSAYVSTNGFISFKDGTGGCCGGYQMPLPAFPNSVIAAFWDDLTVGGDYNNGAIYTLAGGVAPNRWFVVEWQNATECCSRGGGDHKTFEIVLRENGDITLQYQALNGYLGGCSVGVEDDQGLDGLTILRNSTGLYGGKAYQVTRPGPMPRVSIFPRQAGSFVREDGVTGYGQTIRNIGEVGSDTYDLYVESGWSFDLTNQDGRPLTDTNGNGTLDTGPLAQGQSVIVNARVFAPPGAQSGDGNQLRLTVASNRGAARAQTTTFRAAVAAPFAASYTQNSKPTLGYYRRGRYETLQNVDNNNYGYNAAAATLPDGKVVQVWEQWRNPGNNRNVNELYYALLDAKGNTVRPATRITDLSGAGVSSAYDQSPSVAVASDGRIGVTWYRYLYNNTNGKANYNIYFLALNAAGDMVVQPTNITNNSAWAQCCSDSNYQQLYSPSIAAAGNRNYVIAWTRYTTNGSEYASRTYYAVRRPDGSAARGVTQVGGSNRAWYSNLEPLADGSVLLTHRADDDVVAARLDGGGNMVIPPTTLAADRYPSLIDATQLPNGKIALAWTSWGVNRMIVNPGLQVEAAPVWLEPVSSLGAQNLSITKSGNRAVLTWGDGCCNYYPNLYYALLDDAGNTVTQPMIFLTDLQSYYLQPPANGQGATPLAVDATPPANPTNLTSVTHTPNVWSNNNAVEMRWSGATDNNGVEGYSFLWDHSPATTPDAILDTVATAANVALTDGVWYFHVRAVDTDGNWAAGATHAGPYKIDTTPPSSLAFAPAYAVGGFPVWWSGTDAGSGIVSYDVYYRVFDGEPGENTRWIANTTATSAQYSGAAAGQIISFWTAARDAVGNVEQDPSMPDASTRVAARAVTGRVLNLREQPIYGAAVNTWQEPDVYNTTRSDGWGRYTLFLGKQAQPLLDMSALAAGYGELPYRRDVDSLAAAPDADFVLPPQVDALWNGGFEQGGAGWQNIMVGTNYTATVATQAARSGMSGLRLVAPAAATAEPRGNIRQSVMTPADARALTLSFFYKVVAGDPDENLLVSVSDGLGNDRSLAAPLTPGGWVHAWLDLTGLEGQSLAVNFAVTGAGAKEVYIDEVSLGEAKPGSYPVYAPLLRR